MIALVLALGALTAPQEISARLSATPARVEVGEPIEVVLEVEHPLDVAVALPEQGLGLDDSWVVLASDGPDLVPLGKGGARARTTLRARVASLEPGEREIPAVPLSIGGLANERSTQPARIEVQSLLGEGEAHERPPSGFRDVREPSAQRPLWPWLVGFALAVALASGFLVRRALARRRQRPAAPPTALERLGELERGDLERAEEARDAHFALTHILREELDRRAKRVRAGLDDDEWLRNALAEPELAAALDRAELEGLFRACSAVKYGGESATSWAARERLAQARAILERLQPLVRSGSSA